MKKTFYALQIELFEIQADVNHNDVSINPSATRRKSMSAKYDGSFTQESARAAYAELDAIMKKYSEQR